MNEGEYDCSEEQGGVYIPPDTSKTRLLICGQSSNQPNATNINDTGDKNLHDEWVTTQ